MLDFYYALPAWLRTSLGVAVLLAGLTFTWLGFHGRDAVVERLDDQHVLVSDAPGSASMFKFGILFDGVGCVLLMLSGKSRSERAGYNF